MRTKSEIAKDMIGGEVAFDLERLQHRVRQLSSTRGDQAWMMVARELDDIRDRLRQAWGLLQAKD